MEKPILSAILSCSGPHLTDEEKSIFSRYNPFGICLFNRNIQNKKQIKNLCKEIRECVERENIFIAIDQEGGRVRRLREPNFPSYAANIDIGNLPPQQARQAALFHANLISQDLNECTINTNFAPVLDIIYQDTTPALKSRCFSTDEKIVAKLGKIMVDEYISNGIIPCIKHLPGHGRAITDPHLHLPMLDYSLKELSKDFYPFQYNNKAPLGMTAHIMLTQIDNTAPLTMSKKAIKEIIRENIGFSGLLISDSLEMHALKGSLAERTQAAQSAGCELICYSLGKIKDLLEICEISEYLSDKSLNKIANFQKILNNKKQQDINSVLSEYSAIFKDIPQYKETYDATEVLNLLHQN